jgi:hypothetical protein
MPTAKSTTAWVAQFAGFFEILRNLAGRIREIVSEQGGELNDRAPDERELWDFLRTSLATTSTNLDAVGILCEAGYAHQAMQIARSDMEVLIDAAFVLDPSSTAEQVERAKDALAYSEHQRLVTMERGWGTGPVGIWQPTLSANERERRRNAWASVENRAARCTKDPDVYAKEYERKYRVLSSYVHAEQIARQDFLSLAEDGRGQVNLGPSGRDVDVALTSIIESAAHTATLILERFGRNVGRRLLDLVDQVDRVAGSTP